MKIAFYNIFTYLCLYEIIIELRDQRKTKLESDGFDMHSL